MGLNRQLKYVFFILPLFVSLSNRALATTTLQFGVYADEKPTAIVEKNRPILNYLEKKMHEILNDEVKIKTQVFKTHEKLVENFRKGQVDFVSIDAMGYIQVKKANPSITMMAVESFGEKESNNGVFFVKNDSPYQGLKDLAGHKIAFGMKGSSMGHFLPQYHLIWNQMLSNDFASIGYIDEPATMAEKILQGEYDVGILPESVFNRLVTEDGMSLRAIDHFQGLSQTWAARKYLSPDIIRALTKSLVKLKDETVLQKLNIKGFINASDNDFELIKRAVDQEWIFDSTRAPQ